MARRANRLPLLILAGLSAGLIIWLARALILRRNADYFRGKVAIITGASRGIGRALAYCLALRGAHLLLAARSADQLEKVAAHCQALNLDIEVVPVPTDVTDPAQRERLIGTALERFGRIDILINNAGIIQGGALQVIEPESITRQIEINLLAAIHLVQLVLRPMLARGRGQIVVVSSAAGRHAMPFFIPYSVTKHGLTGLGEGLRRELSGTGVRVLTVHPPFTETDMVDIAGDAYRRMGLRIFPADLIARKTLDGMVLGLPEVNIGVLETIGQYASVLTPALADLFWRILMPADFPDLARGQRTE